MFVAKHMTTDPTTVLVATEVAEARRLMAEEKVGHLPVVGANRKLVGLLTKRQVLGAAEGSRCGDMMTWNPVTVRGDTSVIDALRLTCERQLSALPVVSKARTLEGIITRGDLLSATYHLLRLDQACNCIELELHDPTNDAVTALDILRKNGVEPISAVFGCVRDDGDEPVLHVHVSPRAARPAEQALSAAGFALLVPEGETRTREPGVAMATERDAVRDRERSRVAWLRSWEREPKAVAVMAMDPKVVENVRQVVTATDSSVFLG